MTTYLFRCDGVKSLIEIRTNSFHKALRKLEKHLDAKLVNIIMKNQKKYSIELVEIKPEEY